MYINPFLAGVLTVLIAELVTLFIASVITMAKRGKRHD